MENTIHLKKDKILLKRHETQESEYITNENTESYKGTVTHVGPEVVSVKIGDVLYFEEFDHATVTIEKEPFVLVKEDAIICEISK